MNASRQWRLHHDQERIQHELRWLSDERERLITAASLHARGDAATTVHDGDRVSDGIDAVRSQRLPRNASTEVSISSARNFLLWTGAILLAFSALGFGGYEWTHLGPGGRAVVLSAVTLVVLGAALVARRRLPMTAEAIGSVGLAMAAIDWALFRRAGVGTSLSPEAWWTIGALAVGALGLVMGSVRLVVGRVASALAFLVVVPLLVSLATPAFAARGAQPTWHVPTLASIAVLDIVVARCAWRRATWRLSAQILLGGACMLTLWGYFACVALLFAGTHGAATALAALAVTTTAAAPLTTRLLFGWQKRAVVPLTAAATVSVTGAILFALSAPIPTDWMGAAAVGVAVVFLLAGARVPAPDRRAIRAVAGATVVVGSVGTTAAALATRGSWQVTACLAATTLVVVVLSWFDRAASRELRVLALGTAGTGVIVELAASVVALLAPLEWWRARWTGSLSLPSNHVVVAGTLALRPTALSIAQLGVLAAILVLCLVPRGRRLPMRPVLAALATTVVATIVDAPFAFHLHIGGAIVVDLVAGSVLTALSAVGARGPCKQLASIVPAAMAGVVGISGLGWCAATAEATALGLGVVLSWAVVVAVSSRSAILGEVGRVAALVVTLALVGCEGAILHASTEATGTAVVVAASVLLVLSREPWISGTGATSRSRAIAEGVALAGIALPAWSHLITSAWSARALDATIAVLALSLASIRPGRVSYRYAAALLAAVATCCWLATAHVRLVEAYTWPSAAVLVGIGAVARRTSRLEGAATSWPAYGPGLLLGLVPSTALAISHGSAARLACVTVLDVLAVAAGSRWRLQAPLALGIASLVVVAVHVAFPVVRGLPTWLLAGIAGAVLLWLGATAERRIDMARRLLEHFHRFG